MRNQTVVLRWNVKDHRIRRAIDLVQTNPNGKLTVKELAKEVFMSRRHFERVFKRETGIAPKGYLLTASLENARQLLAETDRIISEVAEQVGYSEPKRFRKDFKRRTGLLPSEYRKKRMRSTGETP